MEELTAELVVLAYFYVAYIFRTVCLLVFLLSYFIVVKNVFVQVQILYNLKVPHCH